MSRALSESGLPVDIARDSERYVSVLGTIAEADPKKTAILDSYAKGFEAIFTTMTAISASALVASFFIKTFSMDAVRPAVPRTR
jgi:hypothetical protein